ncbi:caspase family protein [Actinosynnema sp. NPDC020468]|uniref:caspase, EACC1-associated type n=1 Tax=Actinosynnema sp. NPDC020468 TaxID=3154488 RepID=UPI0033F0922A
MTSGVRSALVVGTARYEDESFGALRSPARDVLAMAEVLADAAIGDFTVRTVLDGTEGVVRRALDDFLTEARAEDLVVVYLSCHGVLDLRGRLHFATSDTRKDRLPSTAVEAEWLLDRFRDCRATRQVLILDCCFSGSFDGSKGDEDMDLERRLSGGRGLAVLTASRSREYSFEGHPVDGEVGTSVFTTALVEGLRTGAADADRDGVISVQDAFDYAEAVVRADGRQSPQRWLYGGEGTILLAHNPNGVNIAPAPLPEALRAALDNPYPAVRLGAVAGLAEWLSSEDRAEQAAARKTLEDLAEREVPAVARAARDHLAAHPLPEPEPARTPVPVSAPMRTAWRSVLLGTRQPLRSVDFDRETGALAAGGPQGTCVYTSPGDRVSLRKDLAVSANRVGFGRDGVLLGIDTAGRLWCHGIVKSGPLTQVDARGVLETSPDGALAVFGGPRSLGLWDLRTGTAHRWPAAEHVYDLAVSARGSLIAAANAYQNRILFYRLGSAAPLFTLATTAMGVAFTPDGSGLATVGTDGVTLWGMTESGPTRSEELRSRVKLLGPAEFSPDGTLLATATQDDGVLLWQGHDVVAELKGHTGSVLDLSFSPDSRTLATAALDDRVRLWHRD